MEEEISNKKLFEEIQELRKDLQFKFDTLIGLTKTLIRERKTDKFKDLELYVREKKFADVRYVRHRFNTSTPWALELMKRVGKLPNFRFIPGSQHGNPSRLVYEEKMQTFDLKKIGELFLEGTEVSLNKIMEIYSISYKDARKLAETFVDENPEFYIDETEYLNASQNSKITLQEAVKIKRRRMDFDY